MRGNMKKVSIVVATWIWWNAVVGPAWVCSHRVAEERTLNYQRVTFTTAGATTNSCIKFIQALRDQLASGQEVHGIPVTREPSKVPDSERFVLVELSDEKTDHPVTLALDVTNAYVVAYGNVSHSFFLKEDNPVPEIKYLFPNTTPYELPFSGSYVELEREASRDRADICLGIKHLSYAIADLRSSNLKTKYIIARRLIVVIQMVAEAVRFKDIENRSCSGDEFKPGDDMLRLENSWRNLSDEALQSNQQTDFSSPLALMLPAKPTGGSSFRVQLNYVLAVIIPCMWTLWLIQ